MREPTAEELQFVRVQFLAGRVIAQAERVRGELVQAGVAPMEVMEVVVSGIASALATTIRDMVADDYRAEMVSRIARAMHVEMMAASATEKREAAK